MKLYYINQKGESTPVRGDINYVLDQGEIVKLIMSTGIVIDIDLNTHTLEKSEDENYYTKLIGEVY